MVSDDALLGAARIRAIADELDLRPTKQWGQNFVIDANTVRRIVRLSEVRPEDRVIEVGPGLGSLTLGLLPAVQHVTAVEIDPRLAERLPVTVGDLQPANRERLTVLSADALALTAGDLREPPNALVANLPYNVSVPVILHLLATFPTIGSALVMVQAEVADRLAAPPGSRTYGVPSAKLAWFGEVRRVGSVPPSVFWPEPRIDSGLVAFQRGAERGGTELRAATFAVIDAAFSQRRKALRSALAGWAGGVARADAILEAAGVPALTRGEQLGVDDFIRIANCARG